MNNIKLKNKIDELAKFAKKAQEQSGYLRSKIPLLRPDLYMTIDKLYKHDRESLMHLENELYVFMKILEQYE